MQKALLQQLFIFYIKSYLIHLALILLKRLSAFLVACNQATTLSRISAYLRRCGNREDWEELSEVEKVEDNGALT